MSVLENSGLYRVRVLTNGKAGQGVQGRPGVDPGRVSGDPLYLGQRPPPAPRDGLIGGCVR